MAGKDTMQEQTTWKEALISTAKIMLWTCGLQLTVVIVYAILKLI